MSDRTTSEVGSDTTPERRSQKGILGLRIAAVAILIFGLVVLYHAIQIAARGGYGPRDPGFFPLIVSAGLVFFGVLFLLRATVWLDPVLREHVAEEEEVTHWSTVGLIVVALLIYALVLAPLGYMVATTLFFMAITWILGSRRWVRNLVIAVSFSVILYVGFTQFLGVRLPVDVLDFIL